MAEADIYNALSLGVPALGSRIYPLKLPQNVVYPAVVQQRLTTKRYQAFGKTLQLREPTIQVDVYANRSEGYEAFKTTASAVETALDLYSGGQVEVTYIDEERDDFEENTELFRKSFDIRPWYRET